MTSGSAPRLYSAGSVNADFQVRVDGALGDTETVPARDFVRLSGGKAANVALLARRLDRQATVLACVGDDDLAEQALAPLRAAGVALDGISRVAGKATGVSMIVVPRDGKKRIVLAGNANEHWHADALDCARKALRRAAPGSLLVVDCEIPPLVVGELCDTAVAQGLRIVIDPSFADRLDRTLLAQVHAITPNAEEAQLLSGVDIRDAGDALRAAQRLRSCGVAAVCIKLADGGCVLAGDEGSAHIEAPRVSVVDTTGAGDAFTGAFAVALLERRTLLDAARFAVAASTLAVTAYGSQPAYPDRARIEALLASVGGDARTA